MHSFLEGLYEGGTTDDWVDVDPKLTSGMGGTAKSDEFVVLTDG